LTRKFVVRVLLFSCTRICSDCFVVCLGLIKGGGRGRAGPQHRRHQAKRSEAAHL
jgi:hypothetical protein